MDINLWTVMVIVCVVSVAAYLMYRYLPDSPVKQIGMWVVIGFLVLFLAIRFLKPILQGVRI